MTVVNDPSTKTWNGEPAALKGLITAVVLGILGIYTGQTTAIDGTSAVALAIVGFAVPLVQGYWTRRSVSAVPAKNVTAQVDAS